MTKSLQEIQKENRKLILEAIHGCSYEEALKREVGVGCKILVKGKYRIYKNGKWECGEGLITMDTSENIDLEKNIIYTAKYDFEDIIEIIGKPLTLSRVLLALKDKQIGFYDDSLGYIVSAGQDYGYYLEDEVEYICDWNLTIETLEEQSEETQRAINKLFND